MSIKVNINFQGILGYLGILVYIQRCRLVGTRKGNKTLLHNYFRDTTQDLTIIFLNAGHLIDKKFNRV